VNYLKTAMRTLPARIYEFGSFQLDTAKGLLRRLDGTPVALTPRVWKTLLYMVEHHDAVLDKERIMEAVWPDSIVEENNLTQAISKLRQVFGETPGSDNYIVTVAGRGYRFVAEVKERTVDATAPARAEKNMETAATTTLPSNQAEVAMDIQPSALAGKKGWLIAAAVAAIVVAGLAVSFFLRYRSLNSPAPAGTLLSPPTKSVAVLPFKPLTPDNGDPILEMGMADSLIAKLSNSRQIIVPSVASIRRYGDLNQDPVAAGRELKVNSVLEGNLQRSGDHIRVTARLLNVADGSSPWAATFDEKFTNVFSVQDAISQKVAEALALQLTPAEKQRPTKRYTENVEAYQRYLTGRYHCAKLIPPEIRTAIGFFQEAIEKDPNYALAYFGLAEANRSLAITSDVPSKDSLPHAKAAATKALQIDDALAEAHASLSFSLIWYDWDWAAGEREAKRAVALNPNSAVAHFAHAHVLSDLGRHDEALAEQTRAIQLEPVFLLINALQGMYLYHAHRDELAFIQLQKTLQLDPNFWITHLMLGKVYAHQHKYLEALAEFTKAKELSHGNSETIGSIGYVAALAGDYAKAHSVLDELNSLGKEHYIPAYNIALVYNGLGDQETAMSYLEKACEERDVRLTMLKVDPRWDTCRSNPRFGAVLKRIGLQ
jgi:DNA-binding winged helix-turn-helix (wHTH) protein/TolB-like protein/Flp pilus assembly protein TadD